MPRLVVMMPVRDGAATVVSAVASTLFAMPSDAQLVIWDDASTDGTRALIESMIDPRIRLITSDQVRGSGFARRAILEATDSEFVANIDADDLSLPWRFRVTNRVLREHDMVFSTALLFGQGQVPRMTWPARLPAESVRVILSLMNPLVHSTMAARRKVLDAAGGYSDLKMASDYGLWLRCAANGVRGRHRCASRRAP